MSVSTTRTTSLWLRPFAAGLLVLALVVAGCGGSDETGAEDAEPLAVIPVDDRGFPIEWPVASPPGSVIDCPRGEVSQESLTFSVVMCLPNDPDPFTVSQNYLAELEADGFVEREPGAFLIQQQTFLDGKGIEIYFQLIDNEATIVLLKSL